MVIRWLRGLSRGISNLVADTEDGRVLAALRIGLGLVALGSLIEMVQTDAVSSVWLSRDEGGMVSTSPYLWTWKALASEGDATTVWGVVFFTMGTAALMVVGALGRLAVLAALLGYYSLRSLNPPSTGGYDALLVNGFILLLLAPVTRTWSVDCWFRTKSFSSSDPVPSWPRYLFAFQLVILYFATGLKKASISWTPAGGYEALYYVLHDTAWRRLEPVEYIRWIVPLTRVGTAMSWHWEHLAPILLVAGYFRRTRDRPGRVRALFNRFDVRIPYLVLGLIFHVCILLVTAVGPFSAVSVAYYPSLFGPRELDAGASRVWRWLSGWWPHRAMPASAAERS